MDRFVQILFYVGAFQGFLLTIFLFTLKSNKISNKLLGLLTLLWGLIVLQFPLQDEGIYSLYPHFLKTFSQVLFIIFPLFYLYVKYLLLRHKQFHALDLLHFIPFVISILSNIGFYFLSGNEKIELVRNPTPYFILTTNIANEAIALQGIIYSVLSLRLLSKYRKEVKKYQSNIDKAILKVLYTGISLSLFAWIIGTVGINLELLNIKLPVDVFVFVYLIFVLIIYIISYVAITTPEIFKIEENHINTGLLNPTKEESPDQHTNQPNTIKLVEKDEVQPAPLSVEQIELNERLIRFMENEKPYLNPELSLQELSDNIDATRHQLSSVINQVHEMNFYEFVNLYRIEEVKRLMEDPKNHNLKLISIAYDAGFNSKASFNRIFKQKTNMTPSQYFETKLTA